MAVERGKNPKDLIAVKHMLRVLLARDNSSQSRHQDRQKRELDEGRMNDKPWNSLSIFRQKVDEHDPIEGHEPPMKPRQYGLSMQWNVLETLNLDSPENLLHEPKNRTSEQFDKPATHPETIRLRRRTVWSRKGLRSKTELLAGLTSGHSR